MKRFFVEDLVCNHCVERITKAMEEEGMNGRVLLEEQIVELNDEVDESAAEELLLDLGFTPKKI
ncbi:MAG: metal-binding protein [Eubacteriales bacterium]|nr:metal-binding protein [Eubacteriales bacterium]